MKNNSILFLLLTLALMSCGSTKERVNYEPQPDPFPEPIRTTTGNQADTNSDMDTGVSDLFSEDDLNKKVPLEFNTVYFEFDLSALTDNTKATLVQNAVVMQQYPDTYIRIEGHCDERGTVEYNLALGERRAISARNYLVNFGISPGRITIISYGKERPLDPRQTEGAWGKNRRAEFIILN